MLQSSNDDARMDAEFFSIIPDGICGKITLFDNLTFLSLGQ